MTDFEQHLIRQMVWSRATFGPGPRMQGVIDHIRKELVEVEESDGDLTEWVDVVILALDGLTRMIWDRNLHGGFLITPDAAAIDAVMAIRNKQAKNELRTWPDWRKADPNKAIEHDRSADRE